MKKIFTIIFLLATIVSVFAEEPVQQYVTTQNCPTMSGAFTSNAYQAGNMFDISALTEITITTFAPLSGSATTSFEIYYKVGSYVGYETNPSAWTLAGSANIVYSGFPGITYLPLTLNITIPAGQTYGWYVTSTNNIDILYHTIGTQSGNVYTSNSDLEFKEGISVSYPFGISMQNRVFDGAIHYCLGPASTNILENKLITVTVFPNPTTGEAKVSFDYSSVYGEMTVEAFSIIGEKVNLPQSIQGDGIVIDTQSLSAGFYHFMVMDEKRKLIGAGKFSVQ